jgi:hypothetical protein
MRRLVPAFCVTLGLVAMGACVASAQPAAPPPVLPATDHTWRAADFQAALAALSAVPATQLPRLTSSRGAAVLGRLTDPVTLAPCADASTPPAARIPECLALQRASSGVLRLYLAVFPADVSYGPEVLRLMGFGVQTTAAFMPLLDALVASLDPSDPSYATRMQGAEQARGGAIEVVGGALSTLTVDRHFYPEQNLAPFARILAESFPVLTRDAPESRRAELTRRLAQIANEDRDAAVREALARYARPPH